MENSKELLRRIHELESLFELLPIGVAITRDAEGKEMIANAAFSRMLGIGPGANPSKSGEAAGRLPFRVMLDGVETPPEDLPLQKSAREGVPVYNSRCEIVRDDGRTVMLHGQTIPLLSPDGEPAGSVGAFVDVTERETLIRELEAARNTIKTLTGLLSICAHCKKIRSTNDAWVQFEVYVRDHSTAEFSHSICPSCADEHWGEYARTGS